MMERMVSMDETVKENLAERNGGCAENSIVVRSAPPRDKIFSMPDPSETEFKEMFAQRLVAARIAAGFESKQAMADFLGVSQPRYGSWERGEGLPNSIVLMQQLCDALDVTTDYLFFGRTAGMTRSTYARLAKSAN